MTIVKEMISRLVQFARFMSALMVFTAGRQSTRSVDEKGVVRNMLLDAGLAALVIAAKFE